MPESRHISSSVEQMEGTVHTGGKAALAQRRNSDSRDEEINDLKQIIGDQSLVIDAFKKRLQGRSK